MELAIGRLGRRLEAISCRVIQPAVVRAGEAARLDPTVEQRSAAMRAVVRDETDASAPIAEQHEFLAEEPHELRGALVG
jgi:hypothetical protein